MRPRSERWQNSLRGGVIVSSEVRVRREGGSAHRAKASGNPSRRRFVPWVRCLERVKIESPESVDREEGRRCDLERRDTPRHIRWKLVTQVSVRRILAPVTRAHAHAHPSQGSHNGTDGRIVRDCYDHQRRTDTCIRSRMYERYMYNDVHDTCVYAASGQCIRYARSDVQPSRG